MMAFCLAVMVVASMLGVSGNDARTMHYCPCKISSKSSRFFFESGNQLAQAC